MISHRLFSVVAFCGLITGCAWGVEASRPVYVEPEPAYVEVRAIPVDIEVAPQIVYEGRPTYLYQEHWYYQDGGRWRYYRNEPGVLIEHRRRILQAPPARHEERREERREERHHHR